MESTDSGRLSMTHETIRKDEEKYEPLPVIRTVTPELVRNNYLKIKMGIEELVLEELRSDFP